MYDTSTKELCYSTATTTQGKTFIIDHPMDPEKYLVHACLEGPESGVYYRGKGYMEMYTDEVVVNLPDYVDSLATDFTINLTCVGKPVLLGASNIRNCSFIVYSSEKLERSIEFNWIVYGKRSNIVVEPLKNSVKLNGSGPYQWIS
jgi:hypothetical protein